MVSTTRRGDIATETISGRSSARGSSSVANWLSSSAGRHEMVLARPQAAADQGRVALEIDEPHAAPRADDALPVDALQRRAGDDAGLADCAPLVDPAAMAASHGARSSSVSGMPRLILAMLAGG